MTNLELIVYLFLVIGLILLYILFEDLIKEWKEFKKDYGEPEE